MAGSGGGYGADDARYYLCHNESVLIISYLM